MDFCSQLVLEILDTGSNVTTCIGAAFEVGKNDTDVRRYHFFSHSGKIPEGLIPDRGWNTVYRSGQIRKLVDERKNSDDNRGRGDVNRVYPSRESYLNTLYDVIFGYIDRGGL